MWRNLLCGVALGCIASVAAAQDPGEGQLVARDGTAFPLRHTDVKAEVSGTVASVRVRETFRPGTVTTPPRT